MKLVLRRTNVVDGEWQLDCRKFLKVEIPEKDDGVPGARTVSGTERPGRTPTSSALGEKNVGSGNKVEFDVDIKFHLVARANIFFSKCTGCWSSTWSLSSTHGPCTRNPIILLWNFDLQEFPAIQLPFTINNIRSSENQFH